VESKRGTIRSSEVLGILGENRIKPLRTKLALPPKLRSGDWRQHESGSFTTPNDLGRKRCVQIYRSEGCFAVYLSGTDDSNVHVANVDVANGREMLGETVATTTDLVSALDVIIREAAKQR
jgi:hypothetical protein